MVPAYGDVTSVISIHAPREGGDDQARETAQQAPVISIHAPREGGDCRVPAHGDGLW